MQVACSTICYHHHSWPEVLDAIAKHGWKSIELVAIPTWIHVDLNEVSTRKLNQMLTDRGLKLSAIHTGILNGTNGTAAMYEVSYIRRAADMLQEIGADQIVFTGGPRKDEKLEDLVLSLEKIAKFIDGTPIKVGIENHYTNRIETIEDYDFLLSRVNHPQIGITADFGHFNSSKVDSFALIKKHAARILHVHVKDHIGTQPVGLGEGDVDIPGLLRALKTAGYDRTLSVELEVDERTAADQAAADAVKYMTEVVKKTA